MNGTGTLAPPPPGLLDAARRRFFYGPGASLVTIAAAALLAWAGWLVFDPRGRGEIRSALQMFGNVTFWLFWSNGYDAMRSLDDDFDGRLKGKELTGLAIWRDANANGVSERGEVKPLADWAIVELSYAYSFDETHPDEIPFAPAGVTFRNGVTRPTFDLLLHRPR